VIEGMPVKSCICLAMMARTPFLRDLVVSSFQLLDSAYRDMRTSASCPTTVRENEGNSRRPAVLLD
jgi:hypothetical protein